MNSVTMKLSTVHKDTVINVCNDDFNMRDLLRLKTNSSGREYKDDPFYICNLDDVVRKYWKFQEHLPQVQPFFAVKCNPDPVIIALLAYLGVNFDCASKGEIKAVLDLGVDPERIIFANPCKQNSFIKYANEKNVKKMTFDNEAELYKIKQHFPDAELVIRIKVDDSKSSCQFGIKFGATLESAEKLLNVAKELGLNVIGVSFHVGSGCYDAALYYDAVKLSATVFEQAENLGFNFTLLDIGGGFPGAEGGKISFELTASQLNLGIEKFFPPERNVRIIAEPGRFFVASALTLTCNVTSIREVSSNKNSPPGFMYYLIEKQLPPIRTKLNTTNRADVGQKTETKKKDLRIKSYDYNSWEKYNVDDACKSSEDEDEDIDEEEQEKIEKERRVQNAIIEKEKGNQLFNEGKFEASIDRYTNAITMHPTNPILYANRGMALLKVERFASAEADCTSALELDPKYTKALARRASAREKLHKYEDAFKDYEDLLSIEPHNRQAISEQEKIKKLISKMGADRKNGNMIVPHKNRSKKPLKRITITEVGKEINHTPCSLPLNNKQPSLADEDRVKTGRNTSSYSTTVKNIKKLSVPSSSFIFETEFKEMKKDDEQLYEYIKIIPTSLYKKLFSQCVDGLISPFIRVLHNCYLRDNLTIHEELKSFSKVPRFQMASMFLSQHDKTLLKKLLQSVASSSSGSNVSSDDILALCNEYGVKL